MTKVLVVDDSALMRKVLRGYLEDAGMTVVTARDGSQAMAKVLSESPDVVTLDVNMPGIDGLACLAQIMARRPTPVVMVSVMTSAGAKATVEALELGAVDFVAKPDASISLRLGEVRGEIVEKVQGAATATPRRARLPGSPDGSTRPARPPPGRPARSRPPPELIMIGASTGGPGVLAEIVHALPLSFPPVVIAQHLPAAFTAHLAARLDGAGLVRVAEVTALAPLTPGTVHVARGDSDVLVVRRGEQLMAKVVPSGPAFRWHPSVERLVRSACEVVPCDALIGVVLTGMGDDGAAAMAELARGGGRTIAEAEETAVVWGMPGSLVRRGGATAVLPANDIAAQLVRWADEHGSATAAEPPPMKESAHGTHS